MDKNICRVIIESNSSQAVNLIHGYPDEAYPHLRIILDCKRLHTLLWSSSITYVSRNANVCAHNLAK